MAALGTEMTPIDWNPYVRDDPRDISGWELRHYEGGEDARKYINWEDVLMCARGLAAIG